jgi:hypothetical protein
MYRVLLIPMVWFIVGSVVIAEDKPQRLSPEKAAERLTGHLKAKNALEVNELTTDPVWDRLGAQIFKVKDDAVHRNRAFVIRGNDIFPIGMSFGGTGVDSFCVADLAGDKKPLLIYSYAWGSGDHRSHVAVFDCLAKEPKEYVASLANHSFDDFRVKYLEETKVEVLAGKHTVGRLVVERKDDKIAVSIKLDEKLPEDVRKNLK